MTTKRDDEAIRCGLCGASYDLEAWRGLPLLGFQTFDMGEGETAVDEMRNCTARVSSGLAECGSTISVRLATSSHVLETVREGLLGFGRMTAALTSTQARCSELLMRERAAIAELAAMRKELDELRARVLAGNASYGKGAAEAREASLAPLVVRLEALEDALAPLVAIADAYDANELDDEARRFWGKDLDNENWTKPESIELYSGRGGRELLTLAHCLAARGVVRQSLVMETVGTSTEGRIVCTVGDGRGEVWRPSFATTRITEEGRLTEIDARSAYPPYPVIEGSFVPPSDEVVGCMCSCPGCSEEPRKHCRSGIASMYGGRCPRPTTWT